MTKKMRHDIFVNVRNYTWCAWAETMQCKCVYLLTIYNPVLFNMQIVHKYSDNEMHP